MSHATPAPTPKAPPAAVDPHSVLQEMLPSILRLLRREPALAITIAYLLVALAGIFYDLRYYENFDIPVLSLAQIGDFLVAGIQQPVAPLLVLSTLPLCWLFDRLNTRSRRRHALRRERLRALPKPSRWDRVHLALLNWRIDERWYTQIAYGLVIVIYGWTFVSFYAEYRAAGVQRGEAMQVRVNLGGGAEAEVSGRPWSYLGAVSNYVFLYDPQSRRSLILPVEGVASIEPVAPATDGKLPMVVPIP